MPKPSFRSPRKGSKPARALEFPRKFQRPCRYQVRNRVRRSSCLERRLSAFTGQNVLCFKNLWRPSQHVTCRSSVYRGQQNVLKCVGHAEPRKLRLWPDVRPASFADQSCMQFLQFLPLPCDYSDRSAAMPWKASLLRVLWHAHVCKLQDHAGMLRALRGAGPPLS